VKYTLTVLVVVVLVSAGAGFGLRVEASSQAPRSQEPDVLPALLTEVHALRVAMEEIASAGPRIQLALGRLQLQEQRVNTLLRRIESVQADIVKASQDTDKLKDEFTQMEQASKSARVPAEEAQQVEAMLPRLRANWGRAAANLQRLQIEESTLTGELSTEQGRWADINRQMEELERTLARK
jgi:predicted  nucleic acid-binding Zn-ribbon protein